MILDTSCLISLFSTIIVIIKFVPIICLSGDIFATLPKVLDSHQYRHDVSKQLTCNISHLLFNKFYYLFQDNQEVYPTPSSFNVSQQELDENQMSGLEMRKIGQHDKSANSDDYQAKNYLKVLNRVFSRIELPEIYKAPRQRGGHCGPHIGCLDEIPNFPSLLKKPNVSTSFTIYTRDNPKVGHRILFEPTVHHQLKDADSTEAELHETLTSDSGSIKPNQAFGKRLSAVSWRTASKIIHTQEYPFDLALLEQSGFNASLTTRIIVGGYFAKEDEEWIDEVVKQWLLLEPSNIIKVSWPDSNRGLYHTAAYNSRIVGRQLTLFLYYLNQIFHINLDKFHLVGHSLGAHIAGFVGSDNDGRIARITGLDPAGPIFVELNTSLRLDPSDAKFVDVVHTNGGTITKGALGMSLPSGHVDYYSNGGSIQPGCYFSSVTQSIMDPVERIACSHRRSYRYFIEIIKLTISEMPNFGGGSPSSLEDNGVAQGASNRESDCPQDQCNENLKLSHLPRAFLFEAKQEDLVKLVQPELSLLSSSMRWKISDLAPLKRRLEFHLLDPKFPSGKRGMYFFRTRSGSPFFASKQYALTLKTDVVIRRKIALMAKIDHKLVAEVELDELPGIYTLAFAPNDLDTVNMHEEDSKVPQLSLMWRHRSFNLLMNQQSELQLSGLELSLLDTDNDEQPIIKYTSSQVVSSKGGSSSDLWLTRNQWYKFEGRIARSDENDG